MLTWVKIKERVMRLDNEEEQHGQSSLALLIVAGVVLVIGLVIKAVVL